MESKVQLAIEFHYHILQIAAVGYLKYKFLRIYKYLLLWKGPFLTSNSGLSAKPVNWWPWSAQ